MAISNPFTQGEIISKSTNFWIYKSRNRVILFSYSKKPGYKFLTTPYDLCENYDEVSLYYIEIFCFHQKKVMKTNCHDVIIPCFLGPTVWLPKNHRFLLSIQTFICDIEHNKKK